MQYGEHEHDAIRFCAQCQANTEHLYNGATVYDAATVELDGSDMWEVWTVTCAKCDGSRSLAVAPRPDLGQDEFGWVLDRRDRSDELDAMAALFGPDFVPVVERATVRPGAAWGVS
jgi:hypothetical protein